MNLKKTALVLATLALALPACSQPKPERTGFEYECYQACERQPVDSLRDCVRSCTLHQTGRAED